MPDYPCNFTQYYTIQYKEYSTIAITKLMSDNPIIEPPLYFAQDNLHIWCAQFHPNQNILATTLINGHVEILQYSSEDVKCITKITDCHKSSARYCTFNTAGTLLATCGEDKRLGFIDGTGKIAHKIKKAHQNPINRVKFANDEILISGDDDGCVKVWDLRSSECVFEAQDQSEAITGLYFDQEHSNVFSSCLDGTIAIYDLKQGPESENKLYAMSDSTDQELHGLQVMKNGKYIVCPSSQNSILIYKRENIESFVDRIQGQPGSVESILKLDENTLLSGCQDGFVRAVGLKPNKILQVIGQHEEEDHFPVQSLAISHCRNIVASTSHDNSIKFYDISQFLKARSQVKVEQEQIMGGEFIEQSNVEEEESDLFQDVDSDDDEDSENDNAMEEKGKKKKKTKTNMKARQSELKKESQKKFFKDL